MDLHESISNTTRPTRAQCTSQVSHLMASPDCERDRFQFLHINFETSLSQLGFLRPTLHGQHVQAPTRIALVAAVNPADPQHSTGIADENPAIRRSMQGYWGPSEQFRQCGTQRAQCPSFMTSEPISHGPRGSTTRYCLHDFNTARIVV